MIRDAIFSWLDQAPAFAQFASLFTWLDVYRASATADARGIKNDWTAEAFLNINRLAPHMAKVITLLGGKMTSCYRSPAVNAAVGGVDDSYHQQGAACDGIPSNFASVDAGAAAVLAAAQNGELGPVREIIPEHRQGVVHVDWYTRGEIGQPRIVQDSRY